MTHTSTEQELQKLREELAEETEAAENWRRLALQFDNHRMQAIGHLKAVTNPAACFDRYKAAKAFLSASPLGGEEVLAQRLAELATTPATVDMGIPMSESAAPKMRPEAWLATFRPKGMLSSHSVAGTNLEELKRSVPSDSKFKPLYAQPQEADAKDAARYRWLRDNDWRNDEKMEPVIRLHLNAIWDEKIDAAMAAQARKEKGIEQ